MDAGFGSWLFVVSVGASALGGMLGMASGIFIVPILTLFGGVDLRTAIGASIVSVIACSCGSARTRFVPSARFACARFWSTRFRTCAGCRAQRANHSAGKDRAGLEGSRFQNAGGTGRRSRESWR